MAKKTVRDIDVAGKRVLVRVDFNVPLDKNGHVSDDTRIVEALPTINYLVEQGAKVILVSHLGRPKGQINEKYKMDPVAKKLSELLGREVVKVDECVGDQPREAIGRMRGGDVILLENVRFHPEEEKNDEKFSRQLADLADIYVNDAFGTAHRAHASTEGVSEFLPAVAGFLMEKELDILGRLLIHPERPFVAIIGGAKVSDKIAVVSNLLDKVDTMVIGGGMSNTFLKAQGYDVGKSLLETDKIDLAKGLIAEAKNKGVKLLLPLDVVVAPGAAPDAEQKTVPAGQIPADWMALDIGQETVALFTEAMKAASTIVWNGPMGVFEMAPFAKGTEAIARAMAESKATTIIGGGDSASAVKKAGVADKITHISTGGGASLEFLEGKVLPGVAVLMEK
ncbi:phosphoglycerate kinase [Pelotomaculum propionicicum]|uniref:phosphoglycerate kinase n=1 Tax=Pelotomaculum propionicicum TaxID=258475 RepID=UPI003B7E3B19